MTQMVTYTPQVKCKLSPGIWNDMMVAKVLDIDDRPDYLEVTKSYTVEENGHRFLAVDFVEVDRQNERVLIEFPREADSGRHRIWIPFSSIRQKEKP